MLKITQEIFIPVDGDKGQSADGKRILHKGLVLEHNHDQVLVTLKTKDLSLEEGQQILLFYNEGNTFMQQPPTTIVVLGTRKRFCSWSFESKAILSLPIIARASE